MRFKLDENMPLRAAGVLRRLGHDAVSVFDERMGGAKDPDIAAACLDEARILVTLDLDFADIRTYRPSEYSGIIVLRLQRHDAASVLAALPRIHQLLMTETISKRLWIVEETRTRIRGGEVG